jgi:putative YphP/YqiW family bacilliredoxin
MSMSFEQYMLDVIQPMRDQLTSLGVKELRTPEEVEEQFAAVQAANGTAMVVVNSVCGCAAGQARPGVALALKHDVLPTHVFTVFAGQDKEATAKAREYFAPYPPSSPSVALLKDGKVVFMVERYQIEDNSAQQIAARLTGAFDEYCK